MQENIALASKEERYKNIRLYFSEIVKQTIDRNAVISPIVNEKGNLEFSAEILDEKGRETSEVLGRTYRKLLCIAFDMAIVRAYAKDKFVHFEYNDGI